MTSTERKQARYERRKTKRESKKMKFIKSLGTYEEVFSYSNLFNSFRYCKQGVRWKASIQSYEINLPVNTFEIYNKLKKFKWKSKGFNTFKICERGKMREIKSVHISERCIQRCLCDNYLVPLLSHNLIYDNGASLKNKGTSFTMNRLKKHLHRYYNYNGNDGYILTFDFSNYFGNINHEKLFETTDKLILDENIRKLYHQLIEAFDSGIGLGSQVSQISAVAFPNKLDHYFKDKLGVRYYARFMDDGYIIEKDINKINEYKNILYEICNELDIKINPKKIKVSKLSHTFTFLKKRFLLTKTGQIVIKLSRKNIIATKRRLKKMKEKITSGKTNFKKVENSYKSWKGSNEKYKSYHAMKRMDEYFNNLFIQEKTSWII